MFRELTRKKQSISDKECAEILKNEPRGVLSVLGDGGYPYGMPMNFYYDEESGSIFFHGGKSGHKIDAVRRCDKVSFCVYDSGFRKENEWALNIKSVIVFGRISEVTDFQKAMAVSRKLSLKYTSDTEYIDREIQGFGNVTLCLELKPEFITGKLVNES
ncbi:MAG: pyridoxamine 5'-phosphate oxidase family protein [Clostridia bacterium]|nr:pyridoxamine 5'-phosphate oxidase family protein [Clostridia bacterium]